MVLKICGLFIRSSPCPTDDKPSCSSPLPYLLSGLEKSAICSSETSTFKGKGSGKSSANYVLYNSKLGLPRTSKIQELLVTWASWNSSLFQTLPMCLRSLKCCIPPRSVNWIILEIQNCSVHEVSSKYRGLLVDRKHSVLCSKIRKESLAKSSTCLHFFLFFGQGCTVSYVWQRNHRQQ